MRIRWLRKLDGTLELQEHVDPVVGKAGGDESYWQPVEVVTEQDEAQEAIQQQIAAKVGVTPAQVRRIEELLKKPATDGLVLEPKK